MSSEVVIDQRFRLGRVVRESGVAIVYEARHRNGAEAWIKLPRGPEHATALVDEARVANALGSRAVNVRDDGFTGDGLPYLVLEPVTGQRLDHWRASSGGRAPPDEAMGLGDELCEAIGTLHRAGFSVGLLRADAILVLPKGGMCLLELEHARAATAESVKEDVVRVGRVLYEMLSGTPCLAQSAPLHDAAPELPRAMTSTVDDAARGRFATVDELRAALRASMPDWLGPPRRPMPSLSAEDLTEDVDEAAELDAIVFPRSSKSLFDPGELVDSSRNLPAVSAALEPDALGAGASGRSSAPGSGAAGCSSAPGSGAAGWSSAPAPGAWGGTEAIRSAAPRAPSRPSATELDAPPVAAGDSQRPSKRGALGIVVAAGAAFAVFAAGIVVVLVFVIGKDPPPPPPEAKAAALGSARPPPEPSASTSTAAAASSTPLPGAGAISPADAPGVIEVGDVDDTSAGDASTASTVAGRAAVAGEATVAEDAGAIADGQTRFRFEGHLSPRLVILDGIVVGVTTKELSVPCGSHSVKIGGKGAARVVDLPCAGEQGIVIESNGSWRAE